jgi:hypothetical protein
MPGEAQIVAIETAMATYFEGLYHSDVARLRRVFHPDAIYVCATEAPLVHKTMEEYFAIVAAREAPASRNEKRHDKIVSIDVAGENTAVVKAHCAIGPKYFTDFLALIRTEAGWQIISKAFHFDLRP